MRDAVGTLYDGANGGETFAVYQDVVQQSRAAGSVVAGDCRRGAGMSQDRLTVMVVEDEAALRAGIRRMLQEEGYNVVEAQNGATALQLLEGPAGNDRSGAHRSSNAGDGRPSAGIGAGAPASQFAGSVHVGIYCAADGFEAGVAQPGVSRQTDPECRSAGGSEKPAGPSSADLNVRSPSWT